MLRTKNIVNINTSRSGHNNTRNFVCEFQLSKPSYINNIYHSLHYFKSRRSMIYLWISSLGACDLMYSLFLLLYSGFVRVKIKFIHVCTSRQDKTICNNLFNKYEA